MNHHEKCHQLMQPAKKRRHAEQKPSPRSQCLRQLLLAQLLPLLQLTQLWTVLGGLTPVDPNVTADAQGILEEF
jgi:hypothetical protein